MASSRLVLLCAAAAAAAACLPSPASAEDWIVGEAGGWRAKFNQTGWADFKTFRVGHTLTFMYPKWNHTVVEVGEEDFVACNLRGNWLRFWNTGYDVVHLDKPGKRWFFCAVPGHRDNGMKLAINVEDAVPPPAPAPAPAPSPARWF